MKAPGKLQWVVVAGVAVALLSRGPDAERERTAASSPVDEPRRGGTAVVGMAYDFAFLSPLWTGGAVDARFVAQNVLYTPLFRPDSLLAPVPVLVESWDTVRVAPDSLAITLRLRRDVSWHDGVPTTADDVLFAYERTRDPRAAVPHASFFHRFDPAAKLLDRYTIEFRFRSHAAFLSNLVFLLPAPRHLMRATPPERIPADPFAKAPVGNGPFRFVRYIPDVEWVFDANPDHPEALGGRPHLDRLVLRPIPDATTRFSELATGGIDLMLGVGALQAEAIGRTEGLRAISGPTSHFAFLVWNTRLPMFRDPRVRRAMGMAIDREIIVGAIRGGRERPGYSTIRPIDPMFDPSRRIEWDLEGARRLLEEAGWVDRDGDGIRENRAGVPLRFRLLSPSNYDSADVLGVVQAQLREIGVDARPSLLETTTALATLWGSVGEDGRRHRDFEAALFSYYFPGPKDDTPLLHSRNADQRLAVSGFRHARSDWLMDTLSTTLDPEAALPHWRELEDLLIEEAPLTVLYYRQYLVGVRDELRGVRVDPGGEFVTVGEWWKAAPARRSEQTAPIEPVVLQRD